MTDHEAYLDRSNVETLLAYLEALTANLPPQLDEGVVTGYRAGVAAARQQVADMWRAALIATAAHAAGESDTLDLAAALDLLDS